MSAATGTEMSPVAAKFVYLIPKQGSPQANAARAGLFDHMLCATQPAPLQRLRCKHLLSPAEEGDPGPGVLGFNSSVTSFLSTQHSCLEELSTE